MKTKSLTSLFLLTFLFFHISFSMVFADDFQDAMDMLQQGHKMKHEGDLNAAIELYKKSLDIKRNSFAESSLKSAVSIQKLDQLKTNIKSSCQQYSKDTNILVSCLMEYFFFGGRPIHPKIIEDFETWLSDSGDQVVSINLKDSQKSNRYCCDDIDAHFSENGKITAKAQLEGGGYFRYMFYGTSKNGILVIRTFSNGGGSGIFSSLLLLKTKVVFELKHIRNKILKSKKKRIYLEKIFSIPLGDRKEHLIEIDGGVLVIDKRRIDISSLSANEEATHKNESSGQSKVMTEIKNTQKNQTCGNIKYSIISSEPDEYTGPNFNHIVATVFNNDGGTVLKADSTESIKLTCKDVTEDDQPELIFEAWGGGNADVSFDFYVITDKQTDGQSKVEILYEGSGVHKIEFNQKRSTYEISKCSHASQAEPNGSCTLCLDSREGFCKSTLETSAPTSNRKSEAASNDVPHQKDKQTYPKVIKTKNGGYKVVLGVFETKILAEIGADSLKKGLTPEIEQRGNTWELFLGPYPSKEEAYEARP